MKAYEKEIYEHIKIWDRTGTWYEIDRKFVKDKLYVLFESEQWGDETSCLLVEIPPINKVIITNESGKLKRYIPAEYEIGETYDDIETALEDYDISYQDEKSDALKEEVEQLRIVANRIEEIANKIQ